MSASFIPFDDALMFEAAPLSLWLEDYSGVRAQLEAWRAAGVTDLKTFLAEDPARAAACSARIRVLKVNARTLALFEAETAGQLIDNLDRVFRNDMFDTFADELVQLYEGGRTFVSTSVNYGLRGRRIDIRLNGTILPGHEDSWDRVLVAIEDVTEREVARRALEASRTHARGLFEHSPVSLWVEDFSRIKALLDQVRAKGIVDFRVFTDVHPEFVERCMSEIRVLDVNAQTLALFAAPDKATLLARLGEVFRDGMRAPFREQLNDLWNGKLFQHREVLNYSLNGEEVHVLLQFSVLPGHEHDWSRVQVALTDITARKRAEAYLEFLGKHDELTKLYNRSFYGDELNRIERKASLPATVVVADLNGLKAANDQWGHGVGDGLLRRVGEVLNQAVVAPATAARIGGDEFAILMPNTPEAGGAAMMERIEALVEVNNTFYPGMPLSLSMGAATSRPGERLEAVVKRADLAMYDAKRAYYRHADTDRRIARSG